MRNTQKGITLIALVITIIVMLILVGVTITMAVNGGLFEKAGEAAAKTNNAVLAEQALSNGRIKVGGLWYNSVGEYINKIPSEDQEGVKLIQFEIDGVDGKTLYTEEGMTWGEWVERSDLNTIGAIIGEDYVKVPVGGGFMFVIASYVSPTMGFVLENVTGEGVVNVPFVEDGEDLEYILSDRHV